MKIEDISSSASDSNVSLKEAADEAYQQRDLGKAEHLCKLAMAANPADLDARILFAKVAGRMGRIDASFQTLQGVLVEDPTSVEALNALAVLMREVGRVHESIAYCNKAIETNSLNADAHNNLGFCNLQINELEAAARCFSEAIRLDPKLASAHHNLAVVFYQRGDFEQAEASFQRSLHLAPASVGTLRGIAQLFRNWGMPERSEGYVREALRIEPDNVSLNIFLGQVLADLGRVEESETVLRKAIRLDSTCADAYASLGSPLEIAGRFDEAKEAFLHAIMLEPAHFLAYYSWANCHKVTTDERRTLERMDKLAKTGNLPMVGFANLNYALGKSYDDLGEYEKAMQYFDAANRFARKYKLEDKDLDRGAEQAELDRRISLYSKGFLTANKGIGSSSDKPVFIVGMMRSGTTLTEQILSRHPAVQGAGELPFWLYRGHDYLTGPVEEPSRERITGLGKEYLDSLDEMAPDSKMVCDKNPMNYHALGLIHVALPNARIIHVKRHPVDTSLSIYMTAFRQPYRFLHSKENIVFAYREYEREMAHWRLILPHERLLEVSYEELVADQKNTTGRMLEFLGLEWDDACLRPEENKRAVHTASYWQARQGVYRTSVERWRNYEPWLKDFRDLLPETC